MHVGMESGHKIKKKIYALFLYILCHIQHGLATSTHSSNLTCRMTADTHLTWRIFFISRPSLYLTWSPTNRWSAEIKRKME